MNEENYLWVARDKDENLFLFNDKPIKGNEIWHFATKETEYFELNPNLFRM